MSALWSKPASSNRAENFCLASNGRHLRLYGVYGLERNLTHKFHARCIEVLDALQSATDLRGLNRPAFRLHQLKQFKPVRHSIWVSAQWRITFELDKGEATRVDFEQYH
jgi:proteic killer suppression protein